MNFDRRTLLQGLVTFGLAQWSLGFLPGKNRQIYQQALALSTPRKLALLIGINQYEVNSSIADFAGNLSGCVTDVERQQDLLINRYGFLAQDILTLTDRQASREKIQVAFQEHLLNQAQTGDVVIVHFSGYGSKVQSSVLENQGSAASLSQLIQNLTLLPSDALKTSDRSDLLRSSFLDWGKYLATDKVTYILDTSHGELEDKFRGNLHIRSYNKPATDLQSLDLTLNKPLLTNGNNAFNGTLLTAAKPDQVAAEMLGKNWSGGLFTYALTRYLWESSTPSRVYFVLHQVNGVITDVMGEKQQSQEELGNNKNLFIYGALPEVTQGAEAVITNIVDANNVELNLTGIPLAVLEGATLHSCLKTIPTDAKTEPNLLQISERSGLQAKANVLKAIAALQPGQLLQEALRFIPKQLGLTLALDPRLERVERVDATSALEPLDSVTKVVKTQTVADCVLGKTETGAYALFSPGGKLLFATPTASQAIKSAISELEPALEKQLAIKWVRLTENEQSSTLGIKVTLEARQDSQNLSLLQRHTRRTLIHSTKASNLTSVSPIAIKAGTQIQYRLENYGEKPLYCFVFGQDTNGKMIALLQQEQITPLPAKETLIIPPSESAIAWRLISGGNISRIQVVASHRPFSQTRQALTPRPTKTTAQAHLNNGQIIEIPNLLTVVQALLADLQQPPTALPSNLHSLNDYYVLDLASWATLTFCYRVV